MGTSSIEFNVTDAALNNSLPPAPKYPVGGDQPQVNAGSPTYPVDVSAALTSDGRFLTLAVVKATELAQDLDLTINSSRQGQTLAHDGSRT